MHGLEANYEGQVTFVYLDTDDSATDPFKAQLGYIYHPHLFLLDGEGKILYEWVGVPTEADLEAALLAAIG